MKMKDMALIGMGMLGMVMIEKYMAPLVSKTGKVLDKSVKKASKKMDQMM